MVRQLRSKSDNPVQRGILAALLTTVLIGAFSPVRAQDEPKTQAQALVYEKADRMPATSFYEVPSPLPRGRPGQLIRSEAVEGYAVPNGVRAVRILYHSQNASGEDVAASGVVLLPPGDPPSQGWPLIAWAHGTSGVARICAPSMMRDLYYGTEGLFPMVQAGFAVVAVDYAGLGTKGPDQYVSLKAQAHDVIDGVRAAHAAVPHLSPRWVVDGHSQGGGVAWLVAQQPTVLHDPNFLGAVSVAGAINMPWLMHYIATKGADSFYAVFLAYGIKARFPQFRVADVLTPRAMAQYYAMTTKGCWYYGYATQVSHLLGNAAVRPNFMDDPWVRKFVAEDATFTHHPSRPLLVLAGGADRSVPAQSITDAVVKACRLGYHLQYRVFPGLHHDPLMDESTSYQLRWIRARFAGQTAPSNCATLTRH